MGPRRSREERVAVHRRCGGPWAGIHGGEVRRRWSRAPECREVEERLGGPGCKYGKVQGLHCKTKFPTILWLK